MLGERIMSEGMTALCVCGAVTGLLLLLFPSGTAGAAGRRAVSVCYLFTGLAVFSSAFFTALNNGQVSALISFLRTFVFELGAVLLLPLLFGVDGIWFAIVFAELMAAYGLDARHIVEAALSLR